MRFIPNIFFLLLLGPAYLTAESGAQGTVSAQTPTTSVGAQEKKTMLIDPKSRALDYQQAFELLRKEKTANKVIFLLTDGSSISNIIDMKIMNNGSILLFRFETPQGIKYQAVEIEGIVALMHQ